MRARKISAFVTPFGLYEYNVMAFGLKNAPARFQRLINQIINGLDGVEAYLDDLIVHSNSWEEHLRILQELFARLAKAQMTVNLAKSDFCKATFWCGKQNKMIDLYVILAMPFISFLVVVIHIIEIPSFFFGNAT